MACRFDIASRTWSATWKTPGSSAKNGRHRSHLASELSDCLVQRPGINWTGRVPRFRPKIGVDLRLSAADELFLRAFALGRPLSSDADERRWRPINWIGLR